MKKRFFLQALEFVCRIGLGALFVYSALAKISDPDEFAYSVTRYEFLPGFVVGIFSLTMPMLELLAGLSMLFTKWLRESALLVAGMMAMFIVALAQALARGLEISCGCFGVPSVGGRRELAMALIRDLVLIVPALWLMFRPNGWIEPLKRMSKVWRSVCLCIVCAAILALITREDGMWGISARGHAGTTATRRSGKTWRPASAEAVVCNPDFKSVLARSQNEHRPMVLFLAGKGCRHCTRLEKSMRGQAFRLWYEDRTPLLSLVTAGSAQTSPEVLESASLFITNTTPDLQGYPFVCVYWPQKDSTNKVAFCGRSGLMGVKKRETLALELMSALDDALGIKAGDGHKTLDEIAAETTIKISASVDGTGGTVSMSPTTGVLDDGKTVELYATPKRGNVFLDWRFPNGSRAGWNPHLTVDEKMPAGHYTARFKNLAACKPPVLLSPSEVSIRVQEKDWFKHEIKVDDNCRPVRFRLTRSAAGVKLDPTTGVVTGRIMKAKTSVVEIAIIGYGPNRAVKTVRLTITTFPQEGPADSKKHDEGKHNGRVIGSSTVRGE